MALTTAQLVTLTAKVKLLYDDVGDTADEVVQHYLANGLAQIEQWINRDLMTTSYSEIYTDWQWTNRIILDNPEVTAVTMLAMETDSGLRVRYTGTDTNARVEVTDTGVTTTSVAGATTTTTASTFAANVTTTAMASTINALSGWEGTVLVDYPSSLLVRQGVTDAKDTYVSLEVWADSSSDYEVDYKAGLIEFHGYNLATRGKARVDYTAGFVTLPSAIEQVLIEVTKAGWDARKRDGTMKKEKLGDYEYETTGEEEAAMSGVIRSHETVLNKYKRVGV